MSTFIFAGVDEQVSLAAWQLLERVSTLRPAKISRREKLSVDEVNQLLLHTKSKGGAADKSDARYANIWSELATDLYLGNIEQAHWGWIQSPENAENLSAWLSFDSSITVFLVCTTPWHHVLADLHAGKIDGAEAVHNSLACWTSTHKTLLDVSKRFPANTWLIDANVLPSLSADDLHAFVQKVGLSVSSVLGVADAASPESVPTQMLAPSMAFLLTVVSGHQDSHQLFAEIQAGSLLGGETPSIVKPTDTVLWESLLHATGKLAGCESIATELRQVISKNEIELVNEKLKSEAALAAAAATDQALSELQTRFQALQDVNSDLLTKAQQLQADLSKEAAEHHNLKQAHGGFIVTHAANEQQLEKIKTELAAEKVEHHKLKQVHGDLIVTHTATVQQADKLKVELAAEKAEHHKLKQVHGDLIVTHTATVQQADKLKVELAAEKAEHHKLKQAHGGFIVTHTTAVQQAEKLKAELVAEKAEHHKLKQAHGGFIVTHTAAVQQAEKLMAELAAQKAALATEQAARLTLTQSQDGFVAEHAALQRTYEATAEELIGLKAVLGGLQQDYQRTADALQASESARTKNIVKMHAQQSEMQAALDFTKGFWTKANILDFWIDARIMENQHANWQTSSGDLTVFPDGAEHVLTLPAVSAGTYNMQVCVRPTGSPEVLSGLKIFAEWSPNDRHDIELVHDYAYEPGAAPVSMGLIHVPASIEPWKLIIALFADDFAQQHGSSTPSSLTIQGIKFTLVDDVEYDGSFQASIA